VLKDASEDIGGKLWWTFYGVVGVLSSELDEESKYSPRSLIFSSIAMHIISGKTDANNIAVGEYYAGTRCFDHDYWVLS
jgi:hypothetical protein